MKVLLWSFCSNKIGYENGEMMVGRRHWNSQIKVSFHAGNFSSNFDQWFIGAPGQAPYEKKRSSTAGAEELKHSPPAALCPERGQAALWVMGQGQLLPEQKTSSLWVTLHLLRTSTNPASEWAKHTPELHHCLGPTRFSAPQGKVRGVLKIQLKEVSGLHRTQQQAAVFSLEPQSAPESQTATRTLQMPLPNRHSQKQKKTINKNLIQSYAHHKLDTYSQTQKTLGAGDWALTTDSDSISALQKESVLLIPNPLIRFYSPRMSLLSLRWSENPNLHLQPESSQHCWWFCKGGNVPGSVDNHPGVVSCSQQVLHSLLQASKHLVLGAWPLTAPLPNPGMGIPGMCWFAAIKWQHRRFQSRNSRKS